MAYTPQPTRYTVNHRIMRDYEDANLYWQVHGGVLMEKIDGLPAHVLQSKPLTSQ
jgi:acyl-CoA hydrolase